MIFFKIRTSIFFEVKKITVIFLEKTVPWSKKNKQIQHIKSRHKQVLDFPESIRGVSNNKTLLHKMFKHK